MSKPRVELAVKILYFPEDQAYFQRTDLYHFYPKIKSYTKFRVSFVRVSNEVAQEVIERLALREVREVDFTSFISAAEALENKYLGRKINYYLGETVQESNINKS